MKTAIVKGFGCRPLEGWRRVFGGRRPKASKGGSLAGGRVPCHSLELADKGRSWASRT